MNPITFAKTIHLLFTKPAAINKLLDRSLWFVTRFFIISIFLISLIDTAVLFSRTFPTWMNDFRKDLAIGIEYFPQDLSITWDKQRLTTSTNQKMVLSYPEHILVDREGLPPTFVVFTPDRDNLNPGEMLEVHEQRALLYVTQKNLYISSPSISTDQWSELPLTEVPGFDQPFTVNASSAPQIAESVAQNIEQSISEGWLFISFGMSLFLLLSKSWVTLWYSLVAWLFFKFYSGKMHYKKLLKLTLFLVVIAQAITSASSALFTLTNTTYLFGLSYLVLFFIFFTQLRYRSV